MELNKGKNAGGTKIWTCNHCKRSFSSSYTRIYQHFLGVPAGKKQEIGRCAVMLSDRQLLQKVENAEQEGISPSLTKSTLNYKVPGTSSTPIADAFATVERHQCDVAIVRFLCANGVPFNVLRSPEFAWKDWVNSEDERMKALGKEVANTISDELFWDEVENILTVTKPVYLMIKFSDGEGPKMGEVYEKIDCLIGEVGDIMKNNKHKDDRDKMNEIMVSRWEKMNIPMHCLAFALNPYYYDANYLQIPAPGGEARRAPNYDKEVVQGVLDAFDKIGEDEEERKVLRHQLARFQAKEGIFGKLQAKNDAVSLSPIKWWNTYGAETPELAEISVKVLSQPISSSSAERVWSTYSFVHSIKRNRLNSLKAAKLVFIHSNIRLLSRFTASYKQGPHRKWTLNPRVHI
ncbi:Zinc finger BED domain-containing protein 1 [Bienertia sinuspersici]